MNIAFLFNHDRPSEYEKELERAFAIASKSLNVLRIDAAKVLVELLEKNQIDVVVSNGLNTEQYILFRGLKIVTITFDSIEKYLDLADIVIDCMSESGIRYFTGPSYHLGSETLFENTLNEVLSLIKKAEWDTDFFGFGVGYLSCRHLSESIAYRSNLFALRKRLRVVEYLCNCHDRRSILAAEQENYRFADIRLSFKKELRQHPVPDFSGLNFGLARSEHIPALRELADGAYTDSRYFFDQSFPLIKVKELYPLWLEKAVYGRYDHECYCFFEHDTPIGFCTIRYQSPMIASIGLFGLKREFQGRGLGKKLIGLVENELSKKSFQSLTVVTQGRNYAAQRTYQSSGFRTLATEIWYHKWY